MSFLKFYRADELKNLTIDCFSSFNKKIGGGAQIIKMIMKKLILRRINWKNSAMVSVLLLYVKINFLVRMTISQNIYILYSNYDYFFLYKCYSKLVPVSVTLCMQDIYQGEASLSHCHILSNPSNVNFVYFLEVFLTEER